MIQLTPTSAYPVTYRAPNREEGLTIYGKIYAPPSLTAYSQELVELEDGLYFLMLDFSLEGTYIVDINKDDTETYKVSRSFR